MASAMAMRLAFVAESKGGNGVCAFFRENRKQIPDILDELGTSVILDSRSTSSEGEIGIRLEQIMSVRAQRELWSAIVRTKGTLPKDHMQRMAMVFLQAAAHKRADGVCQVLARMVLPEIYNNSAKENKQDDDFTSKMKDLTYSRMTIPVIRGDKDSENEENAVKKLTPHLSTSRKGADPDHRNLHAGQAPDTTPLKRPRLQNEPAKKGGPASSSSSGALSKKMEERAILLGKQLTQLAGPDAQLNRSLMEETVSQTVQMLQEIINDVTTTHSVNEFIFGRLCEALHLAATSDEVLFQITSALMESNCSSRYAAMFIRTSVLPKILAASSVISRMLLQTALQFSERHATSLVDSLLIPIVTSPNIGAAQGEAITRILRNGIPFDQLDGFVMRSLQFKYEDEGQRNHLLANETALLVLQNVMNMNPPLSPVTVERFIMSSEAALEASDSGELQKSLKFATVLFTLVSKYPEQCIGHIEALENIGKRLTSLMAKSTMRSILKLKNNAKLS